MEINRCLCGCLRGVTALRRNVLHFRQADVRGTSAQRTPAIIVTGEGNQAAVLKRLWSHQGNLLISFIPRTVTGSPLGRVSLWKLTGYNPLSRSTERKAYSDSIYPLGVTAPGLVLPVSAVWQGKRWELWRKIHYSSPPPSHTFKMASRCSKG